MRLIILLLLALPIGINAQDFTRKAFIGIKMESSFNDDDIYGVRISEIVQGSSAARAGLTKNDIILSIQGKSVFTPKDLIAAINAYKVGNVIALVGIRKGKLMAWSMKLLPFPDLNFPNYSAQKGNLT